MADLLEHTALVQVVLPSGDGVHVFINECDVQSVLNFLHGISRHVDIVEANKPHVIPAGSEC